MTQKTGQKCTAVRRILVPRDRIDAVQEALVSRLGAGGDGQPGGSVREHGAGRHRAAARDAERGSRRAGDSGAHRPRHRPSGSDGAGAPAGKGFFFRPTLLRSRRRPRAPAPVHEREVFGPVATLLPYDGTRRGRRRDRGPGRRHPGDLRSTRDDAGWVGDFLAGGGGATGRIYVGSEGSAADAPGSGAALPQTLHGGPGRAGGGEELGGLVGVKLYLQRVAVQGSRPWSTSSRGPDGQSDPRSSASGRRWGLGGRATPWQAQMADEGDPLVADQVEMEAVGGAGLAPEVDPVEAGVMVVDEDFPLASSRKR